jgi:hypothetical protein
MADSFASDLFKAGLTGRSTAPHGAAHCLLRHFSPIRVSDAIAAPAIFIFASVSCGKNSINRH